MMLLVNPQEFQPRNYYYQDCQTSASPEASFPMLDFISMSPRDGHQQTFVTPGQDGNEVAQALEIARESPEGAKDPTVSNILETALTQIWNKVQTQPDTYVMSRDEFAVFNFFQHRFKGNKVAMAARKRYWDNFDGTSLN
jgi:hypothetical protein